MKVLESNQNKIDTEEGLPTGVGKQHWVIALFFFLLQHSA